MSEDVRFAVERGDISVALVGDVMLNRRIRMHEESRFLQLREILRGADLAFGNLETVVRRPDEGVPTLSYATYTSMHPSLLAELEWLGIGLVSAANNHAYDYNESGALATITHLEEAGLAFAGIGRNLAAARAPGYCDTRGGRVGLVAATTTFYPWSRAGAARSDATGRPGINPLAFGTVFTVPPDALEVLRRLSRDLGFAKEAERKRKHFYSDAEAPQGGADEVHFLDHNFSAGPAARFARPADPADLAANMKSLGEARRQADWVIASIHSHDFAHASAATASRQAEMTEPAECVVEFAHGAIDAGADIVAGHGSHTALGIEIYKGRPVFYGLGNFIFQNETMTSFPADSYERFGLPSDATPADFLDARTDKDRKGHPAEPAFWQGMIAVCRFEGRVLRRIEIHPTDAGYGLPRPQRGRPVLARGETARAVLERIDRLSRPYGTNLAREGDTGVIAV
ncbi:CapA family protein [Propylenella binzhouense]|nr:CapA family protein [Propylenella binzhouense]